MNNLWITILNQRHRLVLLCTFECYYFQLMGKLDRILNLQFLFVVLQGSVLGIMSLVYQNIGISIY